MLVEKNGPNYRAGLRDVDPAELPPGDVTVRVRYSTLNYKDALAITGRGPVVRRFPMVPGIDFSGTVEQSDDPRYRKGDEVVLNGWGVGEVHWGGLSEFARVKGDWLIPLPEGLSLRDAMAVGTAGYTAMLCVSAIERHGVTPGSGEIAVSGATGGVGSFATSILASLGHQVVAISGRPEATDYLKKLGAAEVIDRTDLGLPGKPLQKERWVASVDVAGGHTLANLCAQTRYRGIVTACGLAGGSDLPATVMPFILRGVTLAGIDSVMCPRDERLAAWRRLATKLDRPALDEMVNEIALDDCATAAQDILDGRIQGRLIVRVG